MAGTSLALPLEAELLERAGATEELDDAFSHCRRGRGRLVFVSGEAGIGKSALVRHFCARTAGRARVLWGSCDGLRTPRPLGPFVDIGAATGGALAEVTSAANKPHAVLEALLAQLGDGRETVMVLEDLHWADEATLDVLRLLGRRVERLRTVVIATYRSDELPPGHALQIALGDLGTAVSVRRVRLEPLSPAAVAQLAEPFDADPEDLYAKTSGNPFFVTESLASGCTVLPPTVRDAVLARVAGWERRRGSCSRPSRSCRNERRCLCSRRSPATGSARWTNALPPGSSVASPRRCRSDMSSRGSWSTMR